MHFLKKIYRIIFLNIPTEIVIIIFTIIIIIIMIIKFNNCFRLQKGPPLPHIARRRPERAGAHRPTTSHKTSA